VVGALVGTGLVVVMVMRGYLVVVFLGVVFYFVLIFMGNLGPLYIPGYHTHRLFMYTRACGTPFIIFRPNMFLLLGRWIRDRLGNNFLGNVAISSRDTVVAKFIAPLRVLATLTGGGMLHDGYRLAVVADSKRDKGYRRQRDDRSHGKHEPAISQGW
jgi:hypothetical protein